MNIEARRAYIKAVKDRYNKSSKKQKTKILDELCEVCGYSRKHAIKLLVIAPIPSNVVRICDRRPGPPRRYSGAAHRRLKELWEIMGRPCSVNLKQALPLWLPYDLETSEEIKRQLVAMGTSTIERSLKEYKRGRGISATRSTSFKSTIPLKLCKDEDKKTVGYFEADTVAHCGESLSGSFIRTLTMTDLYSGWTENRACPDNRGHSIQLAIRSIEESLPFSLVGFSSDNGSEFLNETVQNYLSARNKPLDISRGRPYKKNDNAHVEQKNFTHVRNLFGYDRIEGEELMNLMNEIYRESNMLKNFYSPCLKLAKKERVGARIVKKYDLPKTPYQRIIESKQISMREKAIFETMKSRLNPFVLQKSLDIKLRLFYRKLEESRLEIKLVA